MARLGIITRERRTRKLKTTRPPEAVDRSHTLKVGYTHATYSTYAGSNIWPWGDQV